jgi:hypothetical protein
MEVRFTTAQAVFGCVFGAVIAYYFKAEWWGYALAVPAVGAVAYAGSLWRLRSLGLKSGVRFLDYMDAWRKRRQG